MSKFSALRCDFCNGGLVIDDSREFAVCEFCGTKYLASTLRAKVQEIRGTVKIDGDVTVKQSDFTIRGGVLERYNGSSMDVVIPDNVSIIGKMAFKDCRGIKRVAIPKSVIDFEPNDWRKNNDEDIGAFNCCSNLEEVKIAGNINIIPDHTFYNCESLKNISFSNSLTKIGNGAFKNCKSLREIVIPNTVTEIGWSAFANCKSLTEVVIPDCVTRIDSRVFSQCEKLRKVILPNKLVSIGHYAFSYCSIQKIDFPDSVEYIADGAFSNCNNLEEIVLPSKLKNLGNGCPHDFGNDDVGAFDGCTNLQHVYGNIIKTSNLGFLNSVFAGTPFIRNLNIKNKRCTHCGGTFRGLFPKVCSRCRRTKDY